MRYSTLFIGLLSIGLFFNSCSEETDPMDQDKCPDFDALLSFVINADETFNNTEDSDNSLNVTTFQNIPDSNPTEKTNTIQITWQEDGLTNHAISILVVDGIWEVDSYSYTTSGTDNSFIINVNSSYGTTIVAKTFSLDISEIELGDLVDAGAIMQRDYTYLKGSFTGNFENASLEEFPISGTFEICNE